MNALSIYTGDDSDNVTEEDADMRLSLETGVGVLWVTVHDLTAKDEERQSMMIGLSPEDGRAVLSHLGLWLSRNDATEAKP